MTALIVDDDQNLLEMIQSTTSWSSLGVTGVYAAYDGETALRLVKEHGPDIVITDIEMPVMDGMAFARRLLLEMPEPPEIIFLTCHAEFDYAKQALQMGAANYLLKPFLPEELTAVLSKAIVRRGEKQRSQQLRKRLDAYEENQNYVMRSFLRDVLDHAYGGSFAALAKAAEQRNISLDLCSRSRIVAVGAKIDEALKRYTKSELTFIFRNIISEVMYGLEHTDSLVEYLGRNHYTGYLFLRENEYSRQAVEAKCRRLVEVMKQYLHFYVLCIVSEPISIEDFAEKKDQIDRMIFYSISRGSGVISLEEAESPRPLSEGKINQQEISACLRERKKSELLLYMRHFLEQHEQQLDDREMKLIHHDLMQVFYGYLYENNISTHDFIRDEVGQSIQASAEFSSVNMMKYVSYMYDRVMQEIERTRQSASVIERAKNFIAAHYMENIGRSEIAETVMLAPNYLSVLFRRETGQTIREYINLCRVEAAKRIMSTTNSSVTDIALEVGYDNISYFSTIFKKYTGLSPVEYRHQLENR